MSANPAQQWFKRGKRLWACMFHLYTSKGYSLHSEHLGELGGGGILRSLLGDFIRALKRNLDIIGLMGVHLSIKAKLVTSTDVVNELKSIMKKFNLACNTISALSFQQDLHRNYDIHHAAYRLIRAEKSLPAQHVINAIAKVSEAYEREPDKLHQFKPHASVRYDARTMVLGEDCHTVSLTVCPKGRVSGRLQM